jgi:hypothetical protein
MAMVERRPNGGLQAAIGRSLYLAAFYAGLVFATPACFADQTTPLSVERPSKQTMVLTQGFSTTIHSERPFGKISITDPTSSIWSYARTKARSLSPNVSAARH